MASAEPSPEAIAASINSSPTMTSSDQQSNANNKQQSTTPGIYNALFLNTAAAASSSSSTTTTTNPLSEMQILEKSVSLNAAAPPLKLAPPFPGQCPQLALLASNNQQHRHTSHSSHHHHHLNYQQQQPPPSRNFQGGSLSVDMSSTFSWKDSDPSKTHAVVVALCLGRAAWDFPSDDAPVALVNGGQAPLLSVDIDGEYAQQVQRQQQDQINQAQQQGQIIFPHQQQQNVNNNNNANPNNVAAIQQQQLLLFANRNNNNRNNNQNPNNNQAGVAFYVEKQNNNNQQQKGFGNQLLQQNATNNPAAANQQGNDGDTNKNTVATTGDANKNENKNDTTTTLGIRALQQQQAQQIQPTIHPPGAPSTLYSWRALRAHSDLAAKSCARAGEGIETLYQELMRSKPESKHVKVITPLVNPTTENIRDVLHKGATDAADEQHRRNLNRNPNSSTSSSSGAQNTQNSNYYSGPNKLLLHYVGHGVPRPERGCMFFSRQATQRQHHAFTPVRDILHLLGTPCMLLCDCASAGNIRSALIAVERELNPYSATKENRFFWGSCADGEPLPHHPLMPDDLFSSIMLSPIRMAVLFFIVQRRNLYDFPPYLVHAFANEWADPRSQKAGTPVAEVRSAFNAIVESIAAKFLSPEVFFLCFRQDSVVMNLFRSFVLAQRIIGSLGLEPCAHPHVPPDTATHSLWQSFDLVIEGVLGFIMRQWRPKPSTGLSVHAFRMSLDPTLVVKNMPSVPIVRKTTFFHDSLVTLQGMFDSSQAQSMAASSVVEPPSSQQPLVDLLAQTESQFGGAGASSGDPSEHDSSTMDESSGNTVDFASYLLQRDSSSGGGGGLRGGNVAGPGNGSFGTVGQTAMANFGFLPADMMMISNNNNEFPSRDLISFVGTRFPILMHSFVSRETRFFGLSILARWLDIGYIAVECCCL